MIDPVVAAQLVDRAYSARGGATVDLSDLGYSDPQTVLGFDLGGFTPYGFVATDAKGDKVLVLRGTEGWQEWLKEDGEFWPEPSVFGPGLVDEGFSDLAWSLKFSDGSRLASYSAIAGLTAATGHSLGAAAARLIAARLSLPEIITFGEPRVGDVTFTRWASSRIDSSRRFVIPGDPIPFLPPIYFNLGAPEVLKVPVGIGDLPSDRHAIATYISALKTLLPSNL